MCGVFAFLSGLAQAQSRSGATDSGDNGGKITTSDIEWNRAITIVDGAALYEEPSFDSTVVDYLGESKQIIVSKKAVKGLGGLGIFYRVKASGKVLYITDTDIKIDRAATTSGVEVAKGKAKPKKKKKKRSRIDPDTGETLTPFFTRYLGGTVGMVSISEKFSGHILSTQMPIYGLRMTGPGTLFDGPPIDFNFLFSISPPSYYSKLTDQKPSGFLLFGDIMPMLPFYEWENSYIYYGVGLMWSYARYKVQIGSSVFDSQEFKVGADFAIGYGYAFGTTIVRADAKYFYERTHYPGFFLTLQTEY